MIFNRLGSKKKLAKEIIQYFPQHTTYIEPFWGAGGLFFQKRKAKYNIVNDLDSDVFNLFQVIMNRKDEFLEAFEMMPIHTDLLKYWKKKEETEPIKKALRFIFLSNLTFMGYGCTLRLGNRNNKKIFCENIDKTIDFLSDVQFNNTDFKKFLNTIDYSNKDTTFVYCDPPYLDTDDNYSNSFTKDDSMELFDTLQEIGCKFAISEFDHEFILYQANKRGLNVIEIGERQNLKNRRMELLITNYKHTNRLFY